MARRLQVYREITLPMLKSLDEENRLRVVDGDREEVKVNTMHMFFLKVSINLIAMQKFKSKLDLQSMGTSRGSLLNKGTRIPIPLYSFINNH